MNKINLPKKHLFLESSSDIKLICYPLIHEYRINMFVYIRYYYDGSCIILSNNEHWLQYHLSKGYLVPAPVPLFLLQETESFHIIPSNGLFKEAKHYLIQRYQADQA